MARERNFRAYGGITWFPYQFALGFSLRWDAEFRAVRLRGLLWFLAPLPRPAQGLGQPSGVLVKRASPWA